MLLTLFLIGTAIKMSDLFRISNILNSKVTILNKIYKMLAVLQVALQTVPTVWYYFCFSFNLKKTVSEGILCGDVNI
jgi:hypothetical protein